MNEVPLVGVSSCLVGEKVRWDGGHKLCPEVSEGLAGLVRLLPICPEQGAGLGVPRPALLLSADGHLGERESGLDHSQRMREWAEAKLEELAARGLAGYILKARSPSCALAGGGGFFTRMLMARFLGLPAVEETMLADADARQDFVRRVRAYDAD